jgi:WD40 repeat protein/tRNA A-37 threonylcarbamoyl transferase component Bud32
MPDDMPASTVTEDRFEQVLAGLLQAEERGEALYLSQVLRSYPELETPLREFFRARDGFDRLAPLLAPTAGRPGALPPPPDLSPGSRFGGYEIIKELGRGGMGIVYHARQLSPQREVALKVIRTDRLAELPEDQQRQWLERFRREAQLVASLEQHTNLVTLYEVGEYDGRPFFTMQLVRGGSLCAWRREPPAGAARPREAAKLVAAVARAVHHAHQHAVLHRDLKPANVLLDAEGRPLVSDFGLARRLDQSGSLVTGAIEGTAEYMAPEQARGAPGAATTAADVYSLGAVLYDLLTGRPPLKGATTFETLMLVMTKEPAPPRTLNPRLPRDLEIICLTCLEKEPSRRYASAAALAEDLENWLAGRPINARPVGVAGRLWRWCRREPVLAGALGFAAVALVAFAVVSGVFAFYRERTNHDLGKAAEDLTKALGTAQDQRNQAVTANDQLRREQRTTRQMTAGLALDRGRAAWEAGDSSQGLLWMARSLTLAPEDDPALQEAIRINLAGWVATLPPPQPPLRHLGIVARVGFTPDGRKIVTLSTGSVRLEEKVMPDGRKGKYLVSRPETLGDPFFQEHVSFRIPRAGDEFQQPAARRPVTARGQLFLWDVASRKPLGVKPPPDSHVLAVTPDGKVALTAKRQGRFSNPSAVQVWDLCEGKALGEVVQFNFPVQWAVCSGDGKTFAAQVRYGLSLWDAATGQPLKGTPVSGGEACQMALSPDGKVLALVSADRFAGRPETSRQLIPGILPQFQGPSGAIVVYDLTARQELFSRHRAMDPDAAVAVGPGGRLLLTVSPSDDLRRGAVRLWDLKANKHLPLPHQGRPTFAQFSPDGTVLLTASGRGVVADSEVVQLWDTATGQPRGAPLLPRGQVRTAAFSPDSKLLAIGCGEAQLWEVQLWETGTGRPVARALRHPGPVYAVTFSPDGTKLVTGGYDGMARIWDTHPTRIVRPLRSLDRVATLCADGSRCLRRGEENTLTLHDVTSGQPCGEPLPCTAKDRLLALGPDKRTLVIAGEGKTAQVWDAVAGKPVGTPLQHVGPVAGVRFEHGGTFLTLVEDRLPLSPGLIAYRWDTAGRSLGFETNPHIDMALAISPDGRWALRALGAYAVVVDVSSAKGVAHSLKVGGPIVSGLFDPKSRTLLTIAARSGSWQEARLWDLATGKPLGPPMPHQGLIRATVFSPGGQSVLTGSDDGTARLWDAATGKQLGPLMSHGGRIRAVAFRPDGKLAATAGDDGAVRLWHVATGQPLGPPLPHPAAVSFVTFGTEGETLITAAGDRVRVWKAPQAMAGDAKRLLLEAEVQTGMELDGGTPRLLDDAERARRTQQLEGAVKAPPAEGSR